MLLLVFLLLFILLLFLVMIFPPSGTILKPYITNMRGPEW